MRASRVVVVVVLSCRLHQHDRRCSLRHRGERGFHVRHLQLERCQALANKGQPMARATFCKGARQACQCVGVRSPVSMVGSNAPNLFRKSVTFLTLAMSPSRYSRSSQSTCTADLDMAGALRVRTSCLLRQRVRRALHTAATLLHDTACAPTNHPKRLTALGPTCGARPKHRYPIHTDWE